MTYEVGECPSTEAVADWDGLYVLPPDYPGWEEHGGDHLTVYGQTAWLVAADLSLCRWNAKGWVHVADHLPADVLDRPGAFEVFVMEELL